MSSTRTIVGGAAVALALALAPAAEAATTVESFSADATRSVLRYRVVVCAPIGAHLVFRTQLQAQEGRTYRVAPLSGRQKHACPIWRYTVRNRFPPGRYTTQVRIDVDGERLSTPRVSLVLPG